MRQETIDIYKFDELEETAQQKVIESNWHINVNDSYWYDCTKDELEELGCGLIAFDIDRASYCELDFGRNYLIDIAKNIIKAHGKTCETYTLALQYITEFDKLNGENIEDINKKFINDLQEEYLSMLRKNYEYYTSEEAIRETIECNEFEFTINGDSY